jgi:PAS domain S-box-containing protein
MDSPMNEFRVDDLDPRSSEELTRSLFADAAVGLSITDLEGRFVRVNAAYCALTGYTEAELIARDFQSIAHPDDLPRTLARVKALLSGEISSFLIEKRYIRKDGVIIWVLNSVSLIRDEHGRPLNLVRLSQDITERLQLKASLRQAEVRTESILANITDVYLLFDYHWRYAYVNEAAVRAIGCPRDQILGRTLWEMFPDIVGTELEREYRRAMDERVTVNCDFYYPARDDWWENRFYPVPAGLDVFATDITERKRAVQAIVEAERKYRDIFENAGEGIFQTTPEGQYIAANPALARMHGFANPEEFVGSRQDIAREVYVDPARREQFKRLIEKHGVVRGFEHQIYRKDGSKIWISVNARSVHDEQGNVCYYEGTTQDISERKKAETRSAAFATLARKLSGARVPLEAARIMADTADELFGWDSCTFDLYDSVEDVINPILRLDMIDGLRTDVLPESEKKPPSEKCRQVLEHGALLTLREPPHKFDDNSLRFGDTERASASIMTLPIRHASDVVGVLSIQSYQPDAYNNEALSHLQVLADYCGEALNRIRAEAALRESEERYRELFENAKDALYVHDLGGRYTSFNRAAEQLSGFSREEIIGKHFSNFVAPGNLKDVRENLCKKLDHEGETTYEIDLITKDRRRVPIEVSSRLIYENGKPIGIQGIARDITYRRRAQEALRTYSQRLIEAQEAERQNIARELHDEIGQVLTAVRMNLQSLRRSAQSGSHPAAVDDSLVIVDEALERVRELSLNLRPSVLDNLGLGPALRWYVDRYAQRSGIVADLKSDLEDGTRLRLELETACFRIAQEALTNVVRHARATHVLVRLMRSNGNLNLKIRDNGVGFNVETVLKDSPPAWTLGLRGMEERALAGRGSFKIDSAPMRGTEVRASFPLKDRS